MNYYDLSNEWTLRHYMILEDVLKAKEKKQKIMYQDEKIPLDEYSYTNAKNISEYLNIDFDTFLLVKLIDKMLKMKVRKEQAYDREALVIDVYDLALNSYVLNEDVEIKIVTIYDLGEKDILFL